MNVQQFNFNNIGNHIRVGTNSSREFLWVEQPVKYTMHPQGTLCGIADYYYQQTVPTEQMKETFSQQVDCYQSINHQPKHLTFHSVSIRLLAICFFIFNLVLVSSAQKDTRTVISLDNNWQTTVNDINTFAYSRFEKISFNDTAWHGVKVPHNWDG